MKVSTSALISPLLNFALVAAASKRHDEKRNNLRHLLDFTLQEPIKLPTTTTTTTPTVITLGDSYSSGTGIHRDGDDYNEEFGGIATYNGVTYKMTVRSDQECWRETDTTPGPIYASANNMDSIFLACKGAEIDHVENQFNYLNERYSALTSSNFQDSIILLTAGGNDIRTSDGKDWPELLEHCILETNFFKGCDDMSKNQISNWNTIRSNLKVMYNDICDRASNAKIRVLGYPKVMQRDPGCSSVTGVGRDEADWMDDQVITLNNVIVGAISDASNCNSGVDIEYVEVYDYLNVGACGDGASNRHVHDKRLSNHFPWGTSDSSFHPSQLGYDEYYAALCDSLP
mmetsp:Transcript_13935/g.21508  ORF Transcript_13935/g.21508 Transcript_13935/m.21508 type:complete len:344 (-) Transcript_13935:199-1230(-)|eukprot:CAMPEP_0194218398 /NCGR_PEP_ID=MMETSP0156-20130528/23669_1 /TAXON_ID=33649 /ORGANISM="Thalassionema nitzschioides, Strain L26-B" /LENGTH=343 /DNA_ID=CAMNT_0038947731 /DNA_START=205 /DNA_END=1236 /DNA_ORIENTATION=-